MTSDQVPLFHICQKALSTEYHHLRPNSHSHTDLQIQVYVLPMNNVGSIWFTIDPAVHMNLNQGSSPWWLGLTPHCLPGEDVEPQRVDWPPCLAGPQTLPPDWPPDCLEGAQRLLPEGVPWLEPQPLLPITKGALLGWGVTEGKAWNKESMILCIYQSLNFMRKKF